MAIIEEVNLDLKKAANYDKAYQNYYEFAKRGFSYAAYKLAKFIYLEKVKKPHFIENMLFWLTGMDLKIDSYYREKSLKKLLNGITRWIFHSLIQKN